MSNQQTSPVAPPSIALALMAWTLAYDRAWGKSARADGCPQPFQARGEPGSAHRKYYAILDRITRGEQP